MSSRACVVYALLFVLTAHQCYHVHSQRLGGGVGPVVGIMTEPVNVPEDNSSYMQAAYARWVEASGGRVVPILYNYTQQEIDTLFDSINGLLFPGGADIIDHTRYYNVSYYLFQRALQANTKGDYFPVWGTCLGIELMTMMAADGNFSILSFFDSENISLPLQFTEGARNSRMFRDCPSNIFSSLAKYNLTANGHHYGVGKETFYENALLPQFYNLLSTSVDRENREFVSVVEAHKYPFYATQFHPEATLYYWNPQQDMTHDASAAETAQYFSKFFVNECRRSKHAFPDTATLTAALIDNYPTVFTGPESNYYFN